MTDEELIQVVQDEIGLRRVCIVRQWLLLDVLVSAADHGELEKGGRQPTILFGHRVTFDSHGLVSDGQGLVTGYECESYGFLFEADGVLIVLAGPGGRRFVSHPAAEALRNSASRHAVGLTAHDL
ncbi:DUF6957 family protein [Pseudomonas putida]|uniref:DUF6957 family protein n=1 Tax=Pseudomonas putida TaxID=303 RepID=UPI003905CB7A